MKDLEIVVISFCFNKLKGRIGTREKKNNYLLLSSRQIPHCKMF